MTADVLDAIDEWRRNAHPQVVKWVSDMAKGATKNKGRHPPEFVAGFEALARLALTVLGEDRAPVTPERVQPEASGNARSTDENTEGER